MSRLPGKTAGAYLQNVNSMVAVLLPSKRPDGGVSMSSLICLAKGQEHVCSSRISKMAGAWLSYHDRTNGGSVVALQKGPSKATLIDLIGLMSEAFLL